MDDLTTYPVLSRVRHNGDVYAPDTDNAEIGLTEKQAAPLKALKVIGEASAPAEPDFDLVARMKELIADGKSFEGLNMPDTKKLLGPDAAKVKRDQVDAALAEIAVAEE